MFGEFEGDVSVDKQGKVHVSESETTDQSLEDRISNHLAKTDAVLRSQQRHEPDLTFNERVKLSMELLQKSPGQFLYRFGKYLEREHLQYFYAFLQDPEVDYYLKELQKSMNERTSRIQKRNRRYGALQQMKSSGSYFSEKEMKSREPLLYEELIGKNLTDEEKANLDEAVNYNSCFSELLFHQMDKEEEQKRLNYEKEKHEGAVEEEDSESEEDEMEEEEYITENDKRIMKEEFYTSVYCGFVAGKDNEFDYTKVDGSEEFDMLDMRIRDEEERYFDDD